jgi:hypothetical protein
MRLLRAMATVGIACLAALPARGEDWVQIGADTQGRYYIDPASIEVEGETIRLRKRAVYDQPLVDNFSGRPVLFKESVGVVEIDCGRRINRVTSIDMLGIDGEVVWSSGKMPKRMWEAVQDNTHGGRTFDYICKQLGKT